MNYTLFYKMIKEAQDSPEKGPATAESNAIPENTAQMPMSGTDEPKLDVRLFDPNAPAVPTQNTMTADQLAGKWIKDKERFYRSKATKYPQYNNWTVSNQTRNKMIEQAQNMLNAQGGREKAWESYNAPKYGITSAPYRDEAFEQASIANSAYIDKVNASAREARRQAEEAQRAQQQPMQNPTASEAIANPIAPIWSNDDDRFNQAMRANDNAFWLYGGSRSQTPGWDRYNEHRAQALAPFYPSSYSASKVQQMFHDDLSSRGLYFSTDPNMNTLWQAYKNALRLDELGNKVPATTPQDIARDQQRRAFLDTIKLPTGDVRSPDQLVGNLLKTDPDLQNMPTGWDPNVWQALTALYRQRNNIQ